MAAPPAGGDALGPLLGSGKVAEVFACSGGAAKVYRSPVDKLSAFREATALMLAQSLDLPVPGVHAVRRFGERWGIHMDRVDGWVLGLALHRFPDDVPTILADMAQLHRRVHACAGHALGSLVGRLQSRISAVEQLGPVRQSRLRDGLATLPVGDRLCHGDFHPWNIIVQERGQLALLDWLDAHSGDPAADICRSYVLMHPHVPQIASDYIDAYVSVAGGSREDVFGWLPFVAAARLAENVPDESEDLMAMVDVL